MKYKPQGSEQVTSTRGTTHGGTSEVTSNKDYTFISKLKDSPWGENWRDATVFSEVDWSSDAGNMSNTEIESLNRKLKAQEKFNPETDPYLNANPDKKAEYYRSLETDSFDNLEVISFDDLEIIE